MGNPLEVDWFDCQKLPFIETRAFDIHGQRMAELMDVKNLGKNHKNQPLVLSGWSVVSNVGIEPKNNFGPRNRFGTSGKRRDMG